MSRSLYEQPRFRAASGTELRPGGLRLTGELAEACALQPGQRVLDVGCGLGATASFLARTWSVAAAGLDASPGCITEAGARDRQVTWVLGRAQQMDFPDDHFDACFCECFLSLLDDPTEVLREVRRVLRPGGALAVTDIYLRAPERGPSLRALAPDSCLRGALGKEESAALFKAAGFDVCVWQDRSEALKTLMASLIFAYGSAAAFWEALAADEGRVREAAEACRPGYYLLVARCAGAER